MSASISFVRLNFMLMLIEFAKFSVCVAVTCVVINNQYVVKLSVLTHYWSILYIMFDNYMFEREERKFCY